MRYRKLGNTGLEVSQLGFGAMRLPMEKDADEPRVNRELALPMFERAFEGGVTYIDTAAVYCGGDSEVVVGEAVKGRRDQVVISTKNHYYGDDEGEWRKLLEQSLRRMDTDYIDVYNHHGLNAKRLEDDILPTMGAWMRRAKDEGLIRHICCSFHDNNEGLEKIVASGYPEVITLQYNMLDRQLAPGIEQAHEAGIGVVVMGPVGGGRLGASSEVLEEMVPGVERVPELAMRFVLSNPNVDVSLSGMSTIDHVEENVAVCSQDIELNAEEREAIDAHLDRLKGLAELYCTGCRYCMPCPEGVEIPFIFDVYNRGRVYGLWDSAKESYAQIGRVPWAKGKDASACTGCATCEDKCPQNIPIRKQLKEAHAALAGE